MYETIRVTLCALAALALVATAGDATARAGILDGVAAIGAGNASPAPTNYSDLMRTERGLNFGGPDLPYAVGHVGADTASILLPGGQVDQVVTEILAGNVTLVTVGVGDNDFIDVAEEIASGEIAGAELAAFQQQVADNIATAVDQLRAAGGGVVLGGFANIVYSPAAAAIEAVPAAKANLLDALSGANDLVRDYVNSQDVAYIDFFALQTEVYENGSAQLGGVDLILSGYDTDPHYFFEDQYHAGIIVRGAIVNLYLQSINEGFGIDIPLLTDLEILTLAGLENEYVTETFADTYAYPRFVAVPEPSSIVLAGIALAALAFGGARRRAAHRGGIATRR